MDGLFKVAGIYSHDGQKYRPVDADSLLPYREARDGQILQEGNLRSREPWLSLWLRVVPMRFMACR